MQDLPGNPTANTLPAHISEAALLDAIDASGFPFQLRVADRLRAYFPRIEEEWGYVDTDTGDLRTLDILAIESHPGSSDEEDDDYDVPLVSPELDVLIECKQSSHPYVFFLFEGGERSTDQPPEIAGLVHDIIQTETNGGPYSVYLLPVAQALSLNECAFVRDASPFARQFSRAIFEKSKLALGGSEAFHQLVLPLTKAGEHFRRINAPHPHAGNFTAHAVVRLAVLDAPMVGVYLKNDRPELARVPWVRVLRRTVETVDGRDRERSIAIDVVHSEYLDQYVEKFLLPFGDAFGGAVRRHEAELATCKAFAVGLHEDSSKNLERRLQPRREE